MASFDEIIATVAWSCGDSECEVGWHKASYWIQVGPRGGISYTVDRYSDGDHEPCSKRDLPTAEREHESWVEYSRWVLANGRDPLGEFWVPATVNRRERWQFKFSPSIAGVVAIATRRAGVLYNHRTMPEHVKRYLNLAGDSCLLEDFRTEVGEDGRAVRPDGCDRFVELGLPFHRWHTVTLDHEVPNPHYVRDLRRAARRRLKREGV